MSILKNSIESQLLTKCNILESQVETLEKQIARRLPKEQTSNLEIDDSPFKSTVQWKEIEGVGKFPK